MRAVRLGAVLLMLGCCWLSSEQVLAATTISLSPAKIEATISSGETLVRSTTIKNESAQPVMVQVVVEDIRGSRRPEAAVEFVAPEAVSLYTIKDKLRIPAGVRQFELAAGESRSVPFTLSVPADARSGSYHGAITFVITGAGQGAMQVVNRLGALVFLRVEGESVVAGNLREFGLLPASRWTGGQPTFQILFENSGETYLNPYGGITVKKWHGRPVLQQSITPWFVLPGSLRSLDVPVTALEPGYYRATVELNRGYDDIVDRRSVWVVIPGWSLWLRSAALAVFAGMVIWWLRKKYRRMKHASA